MKNLSILFLLTLLVKNLIGQVTHLSVDQKIKAIQTGLIPFYQVAGKPLITYTLDERMRFYKVPTVSIAMINNGKIEWAKAYGYAGRDNKFKANTSTLFQVASQGKGITAFLAMELVQDGLLSLDDDANKYLKSWKIPPSNLTKNQPVTVRDLISGWSGLSVRGFTSYEKGSTLPTTLQLLNGEKPATNEPVTVIMRPGTREWESGGATMVVQQMIEDVTGKDYETVLHEKLTGPLGMKNTVCKPSELADANNVANGFLENGDEIPGGWYLLPQLASSGIWSTAEDLAKYLVEIQKAIKGNSKILSQNSALQKADKNFYRTGNPIPLYPPKDYMMFGQTSHNHGYMTFLECSVTSGRGVVIMTNSDNGQQLIQEILNGIDKVYHWGIHLPYYRIQITNEQLKAFEGKYRFKLNKDAFMQVTVKDDYLLIKQLWSGAEYKIFPTSDLNFFAETLGIPARFVRGDDGKIARLLVFDTEDEWDKISDTP